MSAEVRQLLADAATTVDGITVHPYFVQTTAAGSGMVRLDRIEFPNPFGGIAYWNVVLMLPQDQAAAEKFIEDNLTDVLEALAPHMVIQTVQPQQIQLPGVGIQLCVFINGHREEE